MNKLLIMLVLFSCSTIAVVAQDSLTTTGVKDSTIVRTDTVIKQKVKSIIDIEKANRIYYPIKVTPVKPTTEKQNYQSLDYPVHLNEIKPSMRIVKMPGDDLEPIFGRYIKVGFGNYVSPFLDARISSVRNDKASYGVNVKHFSSINGPVDKSNSGVSENEVGAFYNAYMKKSILFTELKYHRDGFRFYGYPDSVEASKDDIKAHFNHFSARVGLKTLSPKAAFQYKTFAAFDYFGTSYDMNDIIARWKWNSSSPINQDFSLAIKSDLRYHKYTTLQSDSRLFYDIRPVLTWKKDNLSVKVGTLLNYSSDNAEDKSVKLYPYLKGAFNLGKQEAYVLIKGENQFNSINTFTEDVRYVKVDSQLVNTNNLIDVSTGIEGELLGKKLTYHVKLGYQNLDNQPFYVNDSSHQSEFNIVYDSSNISNVYTDISLKAKIHERFKLNIDFQYNTFSTTSLDAPFHIPKLKSKLGILYNFKEKIYIKPYFYYISGISAKNAQSGNTEKLNSIVDINLEMDMIVNEKLSVFLHGFNLTGKKYELFQYYPVKSVNVLAGLTYSF